MTVPDLTAWALRPPSAVRGVDGSWNNAVVIVDERYVVRTYHNLDAGQIVAEHRLLAALANDVELPFAVPVPIPMRDGRTTDGSTAVFPFIPGQIATRENLASIELAAGALDVLLRAMADLPAGLAPGDLLVPLDRIRPEVTDLDALRVELAELLPGHEGVAWYAAQIGPPQREFAELAAALPVQIVHGDFSLSNVLIDDGRVTGVLDFEIAGKGTRLGDIVAAVLMASGFGTPGDTERLAAFQRGLGRLAPDEVDAFPLLLRQRMLGSVIWRVGRWRRGHSSLDEIRVHLDEAVLLERWLSDPANLSRLRAFC